MGEKTPGYEIERKFLIAMPKPAWLCEHATSTLLIRQTYLIGNEGERARVREVSENGRVRYIHTIKRGISALVREEREWDITEEAYRTLLKTADPSRCTIEKTRYRVPYAGHVLEIDVFPFWKEQAFLEVELWEETEAVSLPPDIRVLREVTAEAGYTNAALARWLCSEKEK